MRILLLLTLTLVTACQPEMGARGSVSGGISSGVQSLEGTWYTDLADEVVGVRYSATNMQFLNGVTPANRSIQFLGNNTYYDYYINEYVEYTINGNTARICYDVGCNDLRKTP